MFCRLTYSCIQFVQRMIPPSSIYYKNKPIWLSILYKKVDDCPQKVFIKKRILKIESQSVFSEFTMRTSFFKKSTKAVTSIQLLFS